MGNIYSLVTDMDIRTSIETKYKKGNKILFSRDSECLQELIHLIELQKHRTLVMWAFDCVQIPLAVFEEKYPNEYRPRKALELCKDWAKGIIKMAIAKRAILEAHAVANEIDDKEYVALVHAIGQGVSTVHVETHALGLVFYELSAIVFNVGLENCNAVISKKISYYYERLLYWQESIDKLNVKWADFLLDDTRPNKEKLLNQKRRNCTGGYNDGT
ncbi:MAG: putative immunity protein [Acetobacterium sp.]